MNNSVFVGNGEAGLQKASPECQGNHENRRESVHQGVHQLPPNGNQHLSQGPGPSSSRAGTKSGSKLGR